MIAVVYSGSKTAYWKIAKEGKTIAECSMTGINPCLNDEKSILSALNKKSILVNNAERIKKIYVFAAGASSEDRREELANILGLFFKHSKIAVKDDLYGAALAACFNNSGIVGLLGSGAHCAYFDGKNAEKNNFGLGFILGDEGSANYLGKKLLIDYLKEQLPSDLLEDFNLKYNLDKPQIFEKIYRKSLPQQFLSSFFDFFVIHKDHYHIQKIVNDSFESYFKTYLIPTTNLHPDEKIHFVGNVAGQFRTNLQLTAERHGLEITTITKEPIYNLLNYYSN
jgi:N-acetylglucosamine kinase-like BadF-type ATPase